MNWEYHDWYITRDKFEGCLNEEGIEGWELVNFQYLTKEDAFILIFKRPLKEEVKPITVNLVPPDLDSPTFKKSVSK